MKKLILSCVLLLSTIVLMTGCSRPDPGKTVEKFINAATKLDIKGMMQYIEPSQAQQVQAILNVSNDLLGIHVEDATMLLNTFLPFLSPTDSSAINAIEMKILGKSINNDTAEVNVKITYPSDQNLQESAEVIYHLIWIDKNWYIVNIT